MNTDAQALQDVFLELPRESSDAAAPIGVQAIYDDVARSEENILRWMAYLPEDCVKTMIEMGWDITT
jgi:hypothetical protein